MTVAVGGSHRCRAVALNRTPRSIRPPVPAGRDQPQDAAGADRECASWLNPSKIGPSAVVIHLETVTFAARSETATSAAHSGESAISGICSRNGSGGVACRSLSTETRTQRGGGPRQMTRSVMETLAGGIDRDEIVAGCAARWPGRSPKGRSSCDSTEVARPSSPLADVRGSWAARTSTGAGSNRRRLSANVWPGRASCRMSRPSEPPRSAASCSRREA